MYRVVSFIVLAGGIFGLLPTNALADPPVYEITSDRIERVAYTTGGQSIEVPFLYRAGDDAAWASPELDDSEWTLASTASPPERGIGWYRMRLTGAPALADEWLGVAVVSNGGPLEMYLDGELILRSGQPSATRAGERPGAALVPVPLPRLRPGQEHLLAVRFSNLSTANPLAVGNPGFRVVVGRYDALVQNRSMHVWQMTLFLVLTLLLAFQHFLLYLFHGDRRENLYFAAYSGILALFFAAYFVYWLSSGAVISGFSLRLWVAAMAATGILSLLFLYEVFRCPRPSVFRILVVVTVGITLWSLVHPISALMPGRLLVMVVAVEALRVLYVSYRSRRPGALLLASAVVPMSALMVVEQAAYLGAWTLPWLPYFPALFYAFVLLAVAMAIYLARDFAQAHSDVQTARDRLKEANLTLEERVAARTAELRASLDDLRSAQERLVHQEKMASLGALTAGIAHEIKNPLNFVNNFSQLATELVAELRETLFDASAESESLKSVLDDLEQNTSKVVEHGRRADAIVRSMLMHSRNGTAAVRETVNLNALVEEYASLAYHGKRAQQSDLNVEMQVDLSDAVDAIELVPQDIGRVIVNLLGNAFDAVNERAATEPGSDFVPTVCISTRRQGDSVQIVVSDNGQGIPDEARQRIFEPFYTTKPAGHGTGLGLSMSHDIIVQGHQGTLEVQSSEGQGTTFVASFPVR